ncbi:MAG: hypothetical protein ACJ8AH_10450 [Stellaceae bacterium]
MPVTSGTVTNNTIISVHQTPEYLSTISVLAVALRPFPKARAAVAEALKSIGGMSNQRPEAPMIEGQPAMDGE